MSKCLFQVLFFTLVLFETSCGPEAEVGVHFSHYPSTGQQEQQLDSRADSIIPTDSTAAFRDAGLELDIEYLTGKFDPATRSDFEPVSTPYTRKTGMQLRRETLEAFKKMWAAAKKEGVELFIVSSTRTFTQQKNIWEGKWTRFAAEYPAATTWNS